MEREPRSATSPDLDDAHVGLVSPRRQAGVYSRSEAMYTYLKLQSQLQTSGGVTRAVYMTRPRVQTIGYPSSFQPAQRSRFSGHCELKLSNRQQLNKTHRRKLEGERLPTV